VVTGVKSNLQKSFIQKEQKRGVIGVKGNLQKSFIQKKRKTRDKNQFTAIVHSKRAKTLDYRGKRQFRAIIYSKKTQNAGLSWYKAVYRNCSFKIGQKQRVIGVKRSLQQSFIQKEQKQWVTGV
jgi:hypothetical protein